MVVNHDIKDKYIKEILDELEKMLKEKENDVPKSSRTEYIYRTGVIDGYKRAIDLIREYE